MGPCAYVSKNDFSCLFEKEGAETDLPPLPLFPKAFTVGAGPGGPQEGGGFHGAPLALAQCAAPGAP